MNQEKDKYISYVEIALGIGDMAGPAIGGIVFDMNGFAGAFATLGGMIFFGIILSIALIPATLNESASSSNSKVL